MREDNGRAALVSDSSYLNGKRLFESPRVCKGFFELIGFYKRLRSKGWNIDKIEKTD